MTERNKKVWILTGVSEEGDFTIVGIFDNESAAAESQELLMEEADGSTYFNVFVEPLRMNKLNKATREAKL